MKKIYLLIAILFLIPLTASSEVEKLPIKDGKNWAYSMTFDDGKKSVYETAFPILKKYNYSAGLAIISKTAFYNNYYYLNWNEIRELNKNGWDVLSHSFSHYSAAASNSSKINYELNQSQIQIEEQIPNYEVTGFVYPYGEISTTSVDLMQKYYLFGEVSFLDEEVVDFEHFDPETINRKSIYGNASKYNWRFDYISNLSDSKPYWLIEYTHGLYDKGDVYDTDTQSFKQHISYLYNKYGADGTDEVWVAPSKEVYDYYLVYNNSKIKNLVEDNEKMEFYLDMSKVPSEVEHREITLRVFMDAKTVRNNGKNLTFDKQKNYIDFNAQEGKVTIFKKMNNSQNNSSNNTNQNSSNLLKPQIDLKIEPKEIQFNGWTNVSWNVEDADSLCVKIWDPLGKYVYWVCNDSGYFKMKAQDLYYAGDYKISIKATNENGISQKNDSFEIIKWTQHEENPPKVSLTLSKSALNKNDSTRISWNSSDDNQVIASYIYVVDEPYSKLVYQSHNSTGKITLKASNLPRKGNYRVYFRAKDSANNWNYINKTFTYS